MSLRAIMNNNNWCATHAAEFLQDVKQSDLVFTSDTKVPAPEALFMLQTQAGSKAAGHPIISKIYCRI